MATFHHNRNALILEPETVAELQLKFNLPENICNAHIAATSISNHMRARLDHAAEGLLLVRERGKSDDPIQNQIVAVMQESLKALATELSITLYQNMDKIAVPWNEAEGVLIDIFGRELGEGWQTPNSVMRFKSDAHAVADPLLSSDSQGHYSHGSERVVRYLQWMRSGKLNPNGKCTMEDFVHMGRFNGACTFGQVGMQWGLESAMKMANERGSYLMAGYDMGHVGRLEYSMRQAVREGFFCIGMLNTNGGRAALEMNGIEALLGTNPIGIGVPDGKGGGPVCDLATSQQPEGAINVMLQQGLLIPAGLIIERDGTITLDGNRIYDDPKAHIAPAGEHKGLAMGMMADLTSAVLTGKSHVGTSDEDKTNPQAVNNGWIFLCKTDAVKSDQLIAQYRERLKGVEVLAGTEKRGMAPGDRGYMEELKARSGSVKIPTQIWKHVLHVHETGELPKIKT